MTTLAQEQPKALLRKPNRSQDPVIDFDVQGTASATHHEPVPAVGRSVEPPPSRIVNADLALSTSDGLAKSVGLRLLKIVQGLPCIILFLLAWEFIPRIATEFDLFDATFLPPFSTVIRTFWDILLDGTLAKHAATSLGRSGAGFLLANAIAIPLGLLIGWFPTVERFLDPILQTFRQTAAMALFPVFVLLFGIGEPSKIILIYWGAQWPILLSTITGVKTVDTLLIKSARSMNASTLQIFFKVVLPAAFPSIFTGIRLAATNSILILIAAEMIGADRGLGYLVYDSQVRFEIPLMYAAIISLSILGLVVNYTMVSIDSLNSWKKKV